MMANPNVRVPPTTEGLINLTHTVNLTNPAKPANTTNPVDPAMMMNFNDQPLSPRTDPPATPRTEGHVNTEQPLQSAVRTVPRYYAGEIGLGIGKPTIGKPQVDLGENIKLARLKEVVG
uniref:Uncharacterized protein n=1 Tax=Cannabis sativa TaxID=3483 RepID=A0A803PVC0_CANSA